jgi:hypothetical protein
MIEDEAHRAGRHLKPPGLTPANDDASEAGVSDPVGA